MSLSWPAAAPGFLYDQFIGGLVTLSVAVQFAATAVLLAAAQGKAPFSDAARAAQQ